jgi:glyoxylase-like metal-dependent hydrolase (beta-lactamase superfamily II)/rhodanese-related sulfurtransferase
VIFSQLLDDDLGCASYLVGDEGEGVAVVVDPPYAVEPLLAEAARLRVRLIGVVETHTHADHLSGHGRLALDLDVPVHVHPAAGAAYPHVPMEDGAVVDAGSVRLRCIHTPGHRPEHCCLAVIDRSRSEEPWLLLTGDSLFVGDAARPDLAVQATEGARGLFHSLHRLLELPDGVEVFPGHVAGSLCGKSMSSKGSTTIGFERRFNPMLAIRDVDEFVAESASIGSPQPPNLARLVELNRGPFLGSPAEVDEIAAPPAETQPLDVRPAAVHHAGHVRGAINVPVSGTSFATRSAFVLDAERPVCVLAADEDEARRALRGLRSVGFLDFPGFVLGTGSETTETVSVDELDGLLTEGATVIDVREKDERDDGYIPGSRNIPYRLLGICGADIPADQPVVTVCESGARASIAASILAARGYDARPVVDGGVSQWRERGGATVSFRRCGS